MKREIEKRGRETMERLQESTPDYWYIDAECWFRHDLDPKLMLAPQWRRLPEVLGEDFSQAVVPADVVVARFTARSSGPIDLQILRGVLVLRDEAGITVSSLCFFPSRYQWEKCE
jgi:hypothetical protein